jgi:hypothetical protein
MMPEMPQPITAQGPLVWRDMDQKALDDAYDQDVYAPNRPLIVARRIAASERTRAILGRRSASPTGRANTSGSISFAPPQRTHPSMFSSMAAPGAATRRPIMPCRPSL